MADQLGLILGLSLGAAIFTVVALHFKAWLHGTADNNPPVPRHLASYFAAYIAGFAAFHAFETPWSLLVMAAAAALAFAVSIHGRKPLLTMEYARTAAVTFSVLFVLWVVHQLLLLAGIDLLAADFVRRP